MGGVRWTGKRENAVEELEHRKGSAEQSEEQLGRCRGEKEDEIERLRKGFRFAWKWVLKWAEVQWQQVFRNQAIL